MRITRKKLILIILIALIGIITLSSVIYHQTALWKPEQSLITLLPESPLCYVTLKNLDGLVNTFNRSEFGKQVAQMPILSEIKNQLWWKQLLYQKLVWEYEMGGRLDMKAVKGHFGTEVILAIYQYEGELSFLLITEVGGAEKLAIEAITATDALNPKYKRIQTKYNDLTINTIIGYPLDFSYTFIGKIGVLSLNPLLLAEVIDNFVGKKDGFLKKHPIKQNIQQSYDNDKTTGYFDVKQLSTIFKGLTEDFDTIITVLSEWFGKGDYWIFGNRYATGMIISESRYGNPDIVQSSEQKIKPEIKFLPERSALVTFNPNHDWKKFWRMLRNSLTIDVESGRIEIGEYLKDEMLLALITHAAGEISKFPSLVMHAQLKNTDSFVKSTERLRETNITVSGVPLEFLETQEYNGITVQPIRFRLNFLLALTGAYTVVGDDLFFSTTISGLESVLDTYLGNAPGLDEISFSNGRLQTFIQPNLLIPEVTRFIPIITLIASLSGQKLDAVLMQRIRENLFPLEALGPITADIYADENGVDSDIKIVLEE